MFWVIIIAIALIGLVWVGTYLYLKRAKVAGKVADKVTSEAGKISGPVGTIAQDAAKAVSDEAKKV
jgi:hypothetical protein